MPEPLAIMIPAIAADGSLYPIEKLTAHKGGVLHQAVSVFIFCGDDLLIQKRALSKYHCGGLWANTCCTHPHWGETLAASAHRRLGEEMGFDVVLDPTRLITYEADVTNGLREHETVQVYEAHINRDEIAIHLDPNEVSDFAWVSVSHLKKDADAQPQFYAPWFRIYLDRWDELGLSKS